MSCRYFDTSKTVGREKCTKPVVGKSKFCRRHTYECIHKKYKYSCVKCKREEGIEETERTLHDKVIRVLLEPECLE